MIFQYFPIIKMVQIYYKDVWLVVTVSIWCIMIPPLFHFQELIIKTPTVMKLGSWQKLVWEYYIESNQKSGI